MQAEGLHYKANIGNPAALWFVQNISRTYHRRRLPHYYPPGAILFITWRLFGTLPLAVATGSPDDGIRFVEEDRMLDRVTSGPAWLRDARISAVVARALELGDRDYGLYELIAWAIMPNHVHIVIRPKVELPKLTRWLKGSTAHDANEVLRRTGNPFWQYESYDHCVRNSDELTRIIKYVERNPVRAGLAASIETWPWSSAFTGDAPFRTD